MAYQSPNRAGDPVEEGSSWLWDPRYSDSSYLRQLALASPQPQLYQQQRLYHPPAPPPPNCRSLHCSTGGRSQCVKDIPPTDLSIHAPFPPAQPLPSSAGQCVSPTVPPQPEQLTTAASLYESPVAGSTNIPDGMDLEDSLSIVPLNFIESLQDDLFADLPPPSPSLLPLQSANVTPVRSETPQSDTHLPPDICDQSVPPSVVVQENSKTYEPSKSLPSGSAPLPSVAVSNPVIPPGTFIPPSSPLPGDYGFKLHFAEYGSTTPWTFSQALNTLFIKPGDDFAVTFKFAAPPPPGCYVRALVCYGDPVHIQKLGVVTMAPYRDKGSKDSKHSDHFLRCKVPQARYGEYFTHKCVTVTLDSLPVSESGPFCVYSYACYSGLIVGNGKNKPSLKTIFTVIHNGCEIAWDMVTIKCRACPTRDLHKELHGPPKRKTSPGTKEGRGPTRDLHKELHGPPKRKANPDADPTEGPTRSKRQRRLATDATSSANLEQGDMTPLPLSLLPPLPLLPLPTALPSVGIHGVDLVQDEKPDKDGYYNFVWRVRDRGLYNMLLILRMGWEQEANKKRRREK